MMENVIYSILLVIPGCIVSIPMLFFGAKFCGSDEIQADATWKAVAWQLIKGYPFWMWILVFLAFQPVIVHIISAWDPAIWANCGWIPQLSDFVAFISVVIYVIIFVSTDDDGRFRFLRKKSE